MSPGPVVYLALEEKRSEVRQHFKKMGATKELPIFVHIGAAPEGPLGELRKAIVDSQAVFAIVDPLQRLARISDLNDYSQVSLAIEPLMQIARDTGCHIMLIHHANKGVGREGGDSILGSTALFGGVDCALFMRRTGSLRTIESQQRYGEDLPRTVLAFDTATGLTTPGGTLEDYQLAECGKAIVELLATREMTEREIEAELTDHKGGLICKSLRLLFQAGKVARNGKGKKGDPYQYTAAKDSADTADKYIEIRTIPTISTERQATLIPSQDSADTASGGNGEIHESEVRSISPVAGGKGERL